MSIPFNADEIFKIAEQIERNGAKFYRRAAQRVADADLSKKLLDLAAMEDHHEKVFAAMRAALSPEEKQPASADPWGEVALYLRGIADGHVFNLRADESESITGDESREDFLRAAIGREKDSIVLYVGLKEIVPERLGRDKVDTIIREEMGHMAMLSNELASSAR